jgi:hypothetical protein
MSMAGSVRFWHSIDDDGQLPVLTAARGRRQLLVQPLTPSWLEGLHPDEGRKPISVPMCIEAAEQLDVALFVDVPVVLPLSMALSCDEY